MMEIFWRYILCSTIFVISVNSQPPPPPDMPSSPVPIQLDTTTTPSTITSIPECLDLICTLEFIPEECREKPVLEQNGVKCSGCNQWKKSCKNSQNQAVTSSPNDVTCPIVSCPTVKIAKECLIVETYLYLGKVCDKCPTLRANCSQNEIAQRESQCPVQACSLQLIPTECREIPTFEYNGVSCNGCPRWRSGCQPSGQGLRISPRVACPKIACDFYVPAECRIEQEYELQGKMCKKCPIWRDGCRDSERVDSFLRGPMDHFGNRVRQRPCPLYPCNELNVPMDCIQEQPFEYRGRTCFKCPTVRPECLPANVRAINPTTKAPEVSCPIMKCERRAGIPPNCYQPEEYISRGKVCQRCPSIRPECRMAEQPLPFISNDPMLNIAQDIPCPMMACPLVYIPAECRETPTFQVNGKTCQGCPRYRDGCMPSMTNSMSAPNPMVPEIPPRPLEVECPVKACPMIAIPPECREEQPYRFQGVTCYDCPSWSERCRQPDNSPNTRNGVNPAGCPMLGCPRIYIPSECREEQTFEFRGQLCKVCPKWRDGCVPSGNRIIDPVSIISTTPLPQRDFLQNGEPSVPCPMISCPRIYIPPECQEEHTMLLRGRTCQGCPTWRAGCVPSGERIVDPVSIKSTTPLPPREFLQNGLDRESSVPCPMIGCPLIYIPPECREEQTMQVGGRTCKGCTKWRDGCVPSGERIVDPTQIKSTTALPPKESRPNRLDRESSVPCPMIGCPRIYIPPECREEQTMLVGGQTCKMCPKWRDGCVPSGNTIIDPTVMRPSTPLPPREIPQNRLDGGPIVPCPMISCPRIYIPPECQEEQTMLLRGRACKGCPKWRDGCVPSSNRIIDPASAPSTTPVPPPFTQNKPDKACPILACPAVFIPNICQQVESYNFEGQTCYKCPTWRAGCVKRTIQTQSTTMSPSVQNIIIKAPPPSLTDLKGVFPINRIINSVKAATCPELRCPNMFIPLLCREESTYSYQGRTCRGCPRWRNGCVPRSNMPFNTNANGILSFSLFNELLAT